MNTTRSAAARAKPISWLTTIMVMPLSRRERMTSSTEPTSSGSSAEVGSSNSITRGSSAIARAMATRCCWPPESWPGVMAGAVGEADPLQRRAAQRVGLGARLARHLAQRQRHVAERRHVRIEVEGLEHHADALAGMVDVGPRVEHVDAVHHDAAGGRLLQPVEAAQQGRLARARRADHEHQLALGHLEIDALQDVKGAEMLVDAARVDDRLAVAADRPSPLRSRCASETSASRSSCGVGS